MKLDPIDLKILSALQSDGRVTKLRLADLVALLPSACLERRRAYPAHTLLRASDG